MSRRMTDDRCPGVLRPFQAADGAIVRLRAPGGRVNAATLLGVTRLGVEFGQPFVQLTSRGNLQVRGLPSDLPDAVIARVADLGLLPSPTHERVRNIVADSSASLDDVVTVLDDEIRSRPRLTALSGRWVFGVLDTPTGIASSLYDVALQSFSADEGRVLVDERTWPVARQDAARVVADVAEIFVETAGDGAAWNVSDLPTDHAFFARLTTRLGPPEPMPHAPRPSEHDVPDGDAPVTLHLPLGLLDEEMASALHREAADVVLTHERSIVVRTWRQAEPASVAKTSVAEASVAAATARLVTAGFVTQHDAASTRFTACVGAPWCRRTTTPTLALTREAAAAFDAPRRAPAAPDSAPTPLRVAPRTHVVGCERACGKPQGEHHLVVAPDTIDQILDPKGLHG